MSGWMCGREKKGVGSGEVDGMWGGVQRVSGGVKGLWGAARMVATSFGNLVLGIGARERGQGADARTVSVAR